MKLLDSLYSVKCNLFNRIFTGLLSRTRYIHLFVPEARSACKLFSRSLLAIGMQGQRQFAAQAAEFRVNQNRDVHRELRFELRRVLRLLREYLAAQRLYTAHEGSAAELLMAELEDELADVPVNSPGGEQADEELPLLRARRVFRLEDPEFDALVLALAVEMDERLLQLVAYCNGHPSRKRPTIGLVLRFGKSGHNAVALCERPCFRQGLLLLDGDGPIAGRELRVASEFLGRLTASADTPSLPAGVHLRRKLCPDLQELALGEMQHQLLERWAEHLRMRAASRPLLIAGPGGSGRATAAQAAARDAGYALVEVNWVYDRPERIGTAAREALWHDAALLVRVEEAATELSLHALWDALSAWKLPVAIALSHESIEAVSASAPVEPMIVTLSGLSIAQREKLWEQMLSRAASDAAPLLSPWELHALASRFDLLPGTLALALRRAVAEQTQDDPLDFESLAGACRAIGAAAMSGISQRLVQPYTRDDLVLPKELNEELDLAGAWIANRRQVFEEWGFGRRVALGQGLTALFTGSPGTGKTMAAQVLARELGLDLFRVDLSRVMSKFIGETEKNLSRLFDDARASGAILFFDEADALFGKRTEVKDAHDRYANLEISYLLQRMEEHTGTTILATNRRGDLDEAFTRRFHFILNFPMPGANDRRRIWEGMLPLKAAQEPGIDFESLARDYEVAGGEIRNAVLTAAFLAARKAVPIGQRHLKRGLLRELLKTGRMLDTKQRRSLGED
jgi:hypothetical protein